jgi:hypothetical protein
MGPADECLWEAAVSAECERRILYVADPIFTPEFPSRQMPDCKA